VSYPTCRCTLSGAARSARGKNTPNPCESRNDTLPECSENFVVIYFFLKGPTEALGFMNVILLHSNGRLQGGGNNNTNTIVLLRNHPTVKNRVVFG
jgi:hypothetical protein